SGCCRRCASFLRVSRRRFSAPRSPGSRAGWRFATATSTEPTRASPARSPGSGQSGRASGWASRWSNRRRRWSPGAALKTHTRPRRRRDPCWRTSAYRPGSNDSMASSRSAPASPLPRIPDERQAEPQPGDGRADERGDDGRPGTVEEDVRDQKDSGSDPGVQEDGPSDREPIRGDEQVLLVAFTPAQPVIRGWSYQERRGDGGAEEGNEVRVALHLRHPVPSPGERDDEEEGEEDLYARQPNLQLVQELDQLAVELLVRAFLLGHRKRSRSAGITRSCARPGPAKSSPRTTATGTRESFPITSSAAPAISSATAI